MLISGDNNSTCSREPNYWSMSFDTVQHQKD